MDELIRETGSEKATTTCPTCSTPLPLTESAYGSLSAGACPKCHPAAEFKGETQKAGEELHRTVGTDVGVQADVQVGEPA